MKKTLDEQRDDYFAAKKIELFDTAGGKKSQTTLLIELGERYKLFHCPNNDGYAEVKQGDYKTVMTLRTKGFRDFLSHEFFKLTGKGCNSNAVSDAIATLEAKARFDNQSQPVFLRVAHVNNAIHLDTGCSQWRSLHITSTGWKMTQDQGVKFIRKRGMAALPEPLTGGDLGLLRKYVNASDKQFPLILGWMLCAMAGIFPYPILVLQGEQGNGKSTTSRVLRALVDPSTVPLRSPPKDIRDLLVSASNNHVVALDNLSGITPELSDCLCRLSTGGGIDLRSLYTDSEQVLIDIQRPVLINGIDDICSRPDLSERALIINLPVIESSKRKTEREFWSAFEIDKPNILGALLNALAAGLMYRDSVNLSYKPRMADAAQWVTACERGLGTEGEFLKAHTENQRDAIQLSIESSPIGTALVKHMENLSEWTGTPTELLEILERNASYSQVKSKAWPQSTKGMANSIRRLMPGLRQMGITVFQIQGGLLNRNYKVTHIKFAASQAYQPYQAYQNTESSIKTDSCKNSFGTVGTDSEFVGTDSEFVGTDSEFVGTDTVRLEKDCKPRLARAGTVGTDGTLKNPETIMDADEGPLQNVETTDKGHNYRFKENF